MKTEPLFAVGRTVLGGCSVTVCAHFTDTPPHACGEQANRANNSQLFVLVLEKS